MTKLMVEIPEHQYNNIKAVSSINLGRVPYKGIIMYAINAIKRGRVFEQEPRWIPVSERLPETDDEVLCWYEYYHWSQEKVLPEYGIGCYLKETSAWFGEVAVGRDARVIAWMPLHPYKAESETADAKKEQENSEK